MTRPLSLSDLGGRFAVDSLGMGEHFVPSKLRRKRKKFLNYWANNLKNSEDRPSTLMRFGEDKRPST
jgi:hypothetical protein